MGLHSIHYRNMLWFSVICNVTFAAEKKKTCMLLSGKTFYRQRWIAFFR